MRTTIRYIRQGRVEPSLLLTKPYNNTFYFSINHETIFDITFKISTWFYQLLPSCERSKHYRVTFYKLINCHWSFFFFFFFFELKNVTFLPLNAFRINPAKMTTTWYFIMEEWTCNKTTTMIKVNRISIIFNFVTTVTLLFIDINVWHLNTKIINTN